MAKSYNHEGGEEWINKLKNNIQPSPVVVSIAVFVLVIIQQARRDVLVASAKVSMKNTPPVQLSGVVSRQMDWRRVQNARGFPVKS
jgi:hypothetical protein